VVASLPLHAAVTNPDAAYFSVAVNAIEMEAAGDL